MPSAAHSVLPVIMKNLKGLSAVKSTGVSGSASSFAIIAVTAAFKERQEIRILLPSALAAALAAAAEGVSYYAGRGMIYTVLFVGVFALGVLALNLKKA